MCFSYTRLLHEHCHKLPIDYFVNMKIKLARATFPTPPRWSGRSPPSSGALTSSASYRGFTDAWA